MKTIELSKGKNGRVTLVDDEDFEELNQYIWHYSNGYAKRSEYADGRGSERTIFIMHRVIMNTPEGMLVDHINHDTLDNRKVNLRNCTKGDNQQNVNHHKDSTSGYKGVAWDSSRGRWVARIMGNGKSIFLGRFTSPEDAARAYDSAAVKYHGEFARLNFSTEVSL